jgi:hypothetical protein
LSKNSNLGTELILDKEIWICNIKNHLNSENNKEKNKFEPGVVAHAFNPSTREAEVGGFLVRASLVYKVSSRTSRAIQRNPVSKNQKQKNKKTKKQKKKKEKRKKSSFDAAEEVAVCSGLGVHESAHVSCL